MDRPAFWTAPRFRALVVSATASLAGRQHEECPAMSDLNQLFARHQIALINAKQAGPVADRSTHRDLASYYAGRIDRFREGRGLPIYQWV
jgi:hypothetical protein